MDKQTTFNWETFSMFNIIKNLKNCFTREFLHDNINNDVARHFNVN